MKKFITFLVMMLGLFAPSLRAAALLNPEPGKQYMIMHSSGYFMTVTGNTVKIMSPGTGDSQVFSFEVAAEADPTVYNIRLDNGQLLGSDASYSIKFLDDAESAYAQFQIFASHEENCVKFYNLGRQAYLGTDNNSDGGGIYTDKSGLDGKHAWRIIEASASGLITFGLEEAIANAKAYVETESTLSTDALNAINGKIAEAEAVLANPADQEAVNAASDNLNAFISSAKNLQEWINYATGLLNDATVGTEVGNFTEEAVLSLEMAIQSAAAVWAEASAEAYNNAVSQLNAACTAFSSSQIVFFPQAGKKYYFYNTYSNLVMGINDNNEAALASPTGAESQLYEIEQSPESNSVFYLKLANGSGYLATKGGWNSTVVSEYTDEARFQFDIVDLNEKVYTLNRFNLNGAWASDNNNPGDLIYTNKSRNQYNAQWKIVEMDGSLMTIGLENSIALAESYIAKAVIGDLPGNYPQAAVDALSAAVAEAKGVLASATEQDQIIAAAEALNAAINAFLAEKIDPYFIPEANTAYRFSVRKYASNFMTDEGEKIGTSAFEAGNTAQHWTLIPVEGMKYTYTLVNDGKALAYDASMVEIADAPAWTVVYTTTVNNLDYFALVEAEDPSKVLTFGSGTNPVIQDFNAGNDAHQARFLRVDMPNDPNVFALDQAIANAKATLANVDRGNEIGQYSDAKCEAFAAVIAAAEAMRGLTQEEVDAKVIELNAAATDFINNPNAVVKDQLDAAILAAKQTLAAATVGIQIGQYYQSQIDTFEALIAEFEQKASQVTDQTECDELTVLVTDATNAFSGNTEVQPVKDVLDDAIACARTLYENEKDNVGDNQGQRPQEVIDAFKNAIEAAAAIADPTEADLITFLEAREAFLNGTIGVSRTALRAAIATAEGEEYQNLVAGDFNGNYSAEAIAAFNEALASAKEVEADMTKTQEEVDAATAALNKAMTELKKTLVTINFTALDKAIAVAKAALEATTAVGGAEGECPEAVYNALKETIETAEATDRDAINQADTDNLAAIVEEATATFLSAMRESTGIAAVIAEAEELLDNAVSGFKPGNYPVSAIDALRTALEAAKAVVADNAATQAALIDAKNALAEEIETFKAQAVPALDLTELIALIAEAEQFIEANDVDDFILEIALQDAKDLVEDPDNYTKSQLEEITTALREALDEARGTVGVAGTFADAITVEAANGHLYVSGINAEVTVAVYTFDGRTVLMTRADSDIEAALEAGSYIVAISSAEGTVTYKLYIK